MKRSDKRLIKAYAAKHGQDAGAETAASPLDIPKRVFAGKLLQAIGCLALVHVLAVAALWVPIFFIDGAPLFPDLGPGSSYAVVASEEFSQFEADLEDNPRVVRMLGESFVHPQPAAIGVFVDLVCDGAGAPPSAIELVGVPWGLGYREASATDLSRRATADCNLREEDRKLVKNLIAAAIAEYRESTPTRRVLRAICGWIQALIIVSTSWGILLLRLRYRWAGLQLRNIRSGSLPDRPDISVWDLEAVTRTGLLTAEKKERGLILLPVRLILDVVCGKVEDPSVPARELIRARIASYRKAIEAGEYETIHFLRWIAPTLGFLGTILGIVSAMEAAPKIVQGGDPTAQADALRTISISLGTAFDTTFLALLLSIPMTFLFFQTRRLEMSTLSVLEETAMPPLSRLLDAQRDPAPIQWPDRSDSAFHVEEKTA